MRVTVIPAGELDESLIGRWRTIQHAAENLASPFFCPEFTIAAADFYPNTQVGVIEDGGSVVGFLPFERQWGRAGRTVAHPHCDYNGVIIGKDVEWNARDLVRRCGLRSLEFEHLITSQKPFDKHHGEQSTSHVIDLRCGFAAYHREHRGRRLAELAKQTTREVGPLRLEIHDPSDVALDQMIDLKRGHYAQMGVFDVFSQPPLRDFMLRLHATSSPSFSGLLTVLYMGDKMAAANFGLRSRTAWHWWIPTYDPRFQKYSPGLIMLQRMIEACEGMGINMIDLGYGDEPYKLRVANGAIGIAGGRVGTSLPALIRDRVRNMKRRLGGTRLERPALAVYRAIKRAVVPWFETNTAKGAA